MSRPILAEISLSALAHNLQVARRVSGSNKIWAVVKARAYGHGLKAALGGCAAADGFAVLDLDEAVILREAGWQGSILVFEGCFKTDDLKLAAHHQLNLVVHQEDQVRMLEGCSLSSRLAIYLKMNSGMNRLGFASQNYRAAYARLHALAHVSNITHMTHFANADAKESVAVSVQQQMQLFETTLGKLPGERSVSNSAAMLSGIPLRSDWVRPGIMLYGSSPFAHRSARELGLKPAMTLRSEIIATQQLQMGDYVGYGSIYRAERPMRIGVIACGYADGYPRHAPGTNQRNAPVLVDGQRTRLIGRVSMDRITVDITHLPQANLGTPVTLWGEGLSVDEVAQAAGTIGYELLCAVSARVPVLEID